MRDKAAEGVLSLCAEFLKASVHCDDCWEFGRGGEEICERILGYDSGCNNYPIFIGVERGKPPGSGYKVRTDIPVVVNRSQNLPEYLIAYLMKNVPAVKAIRQDISFKISRPRGLGESENIRLKLVQLRSEANRWVEDLEKYIREEMYWDIDEMGSDAIRRFVEEYIDSHRPENCSLEDLHEHPCAYSEGEKSYHIHLECEAEGIKELKTILRGLEKSYSEDALDGLNVKSSRIKVFTGKEEQQVHEAAEKWLGDNIERLHDIKRELESLELQYPLWEPRKESAMTGQSEDSRAREILGRELNIVSREAEQNPQDMMAQLRLRLWKRTAAKAGVFL